MQFQESLIQFLHRLTLRVYHLPSSKSFSYIPFLFLIPRDRLYLPLCFSQVSFLFFRFFHPPKSTLSFFQPYSSVYLPFCAHLNNCNTFPSPSFLLYLPSFTHPCLPCNCIPIVIQYLRSPTLFLSSSHVFPCSCLLFQALQTFFYFFCQNNSPVIPDPVYIASHTNIITQNLTK